MVPKSPSGEDAGETSIGFEFKLFFGYVGLDSRAHQNNLGLYL